MTKVALALCPLIALSVLTSQARAVVLFGQSGNDLLVDIRDPITFVATASSNTAAYGIVFEDVYSVSNTSNSRVVPPILTSTMTIGESTNTRYATWGQQTGSMHVVDDKDFFGHYVFQTATALSVGDHVTVSSGVVTLPDFFTRIGATLPDNPVRTAQLFERSFNAVSDPVLVPEPSAFFMCLGFVSSGLMARRL